MSDKKANSSPTPTRTEQILDPAVRKVAEGYGGVEGLRHELERRKRLNAWHKNQRLRSR